MAVTSVNSRIFDLRGRKLRLDTREDIEPYFKDIDVEKVEEVYLSDNTIGVSAAQALGERLSSMKTLKVAGLSDIFVSRSIEEVPDALTAICNALKDAARLVDLDLSNNAFGGRAVYPLVPLLTHNRAIQVLKLHNNGLGPEGGAVVAKALLEAARLSSAQGQPSSLRVIICGRNRLEDHAAHTWGQALAAHENLQKVKMVNNGFREDGFRAIVHGLAKCRDLRYLSLRDNLSRNVSTNPALDDSERGWHAIVDLLSFAKQLQFLDLSDCGLDVLGSAAISRALASGTQSKLQTLLLENNDMTGAVYGDLADAVLHHLPSLATLSLACNDDLEHESVVAMTESLEDRGGRVVVNDDHEEDLEDDAADAEKETQFVNESAIVVDSGLVLAQKESQPVDELAEELSQLAIKSTGADA
ncbi:Ran GTPase-activating protein 1 [Grifola frondosa]|uniref:Ran GTPase-activating protein 1 n=1 Tax=Grifola frondosa TaxID=5627 RepID=A0A1C7M244_GRIFR|nr:Ran GTPase-activating protein 1 [Grifola frondosa]